MNSNKQICEKKEKKGKFINRKNNTINSLKEVEIFLCNWKKVFKGIQLYKILK